MLLVADDLQLEVFVFVVGLQEQNKFAVLEKGGHIHSSCNAAVKCLQLLIKAVINL